MDYKLLHLKDGKHADKYVILLNGDRFIYSPSQSEWSYLADAEEGSRTIDLDALQQVDNSHFEQSTGRRLDESLANSMLYLEDRLYKTTDSEVWIFWHGGRSHCCDRGHFFGDDDRDGGEEYDWTWKVHDRDRFDEWELEVTKPLDFLLATGKDLGKSVREQLNMNLPTFLGSQGAGEETGTSKGDHQKTAKVGQPTDDDE